VITDLEIRKAKPRETRYNLADQGGLYLLVLPSGKKVWRLAHRVSGKTRQTTLGHYPEMSLIAAREAQFEMKRRVKSGAPVSEDTFRAISHELQTRKAEAGLSPRTLETFKWLCRLAEDVIGDRKLHDIRPNECWGVVKAIEDSGRRHTARRVRTAMGEVFRFGMRTGRSHGDPTAALRGALMKPRTKHRAAITSPERFGVLLSLIDAYPGSYSIRLALKFSALTFARPGEIRGARFSEINGDVWTIPKERMKGGRIHHDVPLSRQALAVVEEARRFPHRDFIFPSVRSLDRPLSENTLGSALLSMGITSEEHVPHGFRASASTMLNEQGFVKDVVEKQLAHLDEDDVRRAYNRALYWLERVTMMQRWADYLDELKKDSAL